MTKKHDVKHEFHHTYDTEKSLLALETSRSGLNSKHVSERIEKYGKNELVEGEKTAWYVLLISQFNNLLIYILVLSAVISIFLDKVIEPIAILTIVVLAGVTGFIQEFQAGKALDSLKKMASPTARVLRDGKEVEIPSSELVPGDIIILHAGDKIPADARVIESSNLKIDEAALTGESLPVNKHTDAIPNENTPLGDRKNMLYMGTSVVYGKGLALVVLTGMQTEFGKIANMIESAEQRRTPLLESLDKLGKQLGIFSLGLATVVSVFDYMRGSTLDEVFLWGVALAVAIIPEALPAVVTITLALGVKRMVRRRALIRKLPAVETLGSTNIICSDKTGTLTQDEMTIRKIYAGGQSYTVTGVGYKPEGDFIKDDKKVSVNDVKELERLITYSVLCNDTALVMKEGAWDVLGDPTEGSMLVVAKKAGMDMDTIKKERPRVFDIPFASETKRMSTVNKIGDANVAISKGAVEVILDSCTSVIIGDEIKPLTKEEKESILNISLQFASSALRVLAIGVKKLDSDDFSDANIQSGLTFVGMVGMIDPPREEVKAAIKVCEHAGIKPIMITGDHKVTAVAVARELGIMKDGIAVSGVELETMSEEEFQSTVDKAEVYARISPAHKMKIVSALMDRGNIVAMTGDGVNDAPSLKKADIGIAMGITGTDVSKDASDMILTDDNFASIVSAVEEGRSIFENIRKYLVFLLGGNMGTVFGLVAALLIGFPVPLVAVHILFINFIMDGILAITLGVEQPEHGIMNRRPRKMSEGILSKQAVWSILFQGLWIAAVCMGVFVYYGGAQIDFDAVKASPYTMSLFYATLVVARIFNGMACRSINESFFSYGLAGNRSLVLGMISTFILTVITINFTPMNVIFSTTPLGLTDWMVVIGAGASVLLFSEIYKIIQNKVLA